MKQYNMFHIPVLSFFSGRLYHDVCRHWKGICFFYLLLILAICWIPTSMKASNAWQTLMDEHLPDVCVQIPTVTITDGELSIDKPEPYIISDPDKGMPMMIIDTTGEHTSLDDSEAICLVTQTEIFVQSNPNKIEVYSLKEIDSLELNRDIVEGWLSKLTPIVKGVIYPVGLFGSFMFRLMQALFFAIVGLIIGSCIGQELPFGAYMRMAVVAMTPSMICKTVLFAIGISIPFMSLLYVLSVVGLLIYALKATKRLKVLDDELEVLDAAQGHVVS